MRGDVNRKEDVLLIQFFLRVVMEDADSPGYRSPGQRSIQIDEIYGPQTQAYIDFFQSEAKKRNPQRMPIIGGKANPLHTPFRITPAENQVHNIYAVNRLYQKRRPLHGNLANDPLCPGELASSVY